MARTSEQASKLKVFISYARADLAFADELVAGLELTGFEPLIDRHSISGGEEWRQRLGGLIRDADTVVFVLSPDSGASQMCAWEVEETARLSKRILPVLWRKVDDAAVPTRLQALNYIFFSEGHSFARGLGELTRALNTDLEWVREHTRLGDLAARWNDRGRPPELLLRGGEVADARGWLARRPREAPEPTEIIRAYIAESGRSTARRQRMLMGASLGVAALTTALGVFAFLQKQVADGERNTAVESRQLAEANAKRAQESEKRAQSRLLANLAAQSVAAGDATAGMLLGIEALPDPKAPDRPYVAEAEAALYNGYSSRQEIAVLKGHTDKVEDAIFSPDGRRILTTSQDKTVRLWDAASARQLKLWSGNSPGHALYSSDGKRIAISFDDTIRILDAGTGAELSAWTSAWTLKSQTSILFSADGTKLAGVSHKAERVKVWDTASGRELSILLAGNGYFDFSPEGGRIVTSGPVPSKATVWDVATGRALLELEGPGGSLYDVSWSRDGALIAAGSDANVARIWDARTGREIATLKGHSHVVWSASFSPDSAKLVTVSNDFTARIWDARTGAAGPILKGHTGWVTHAAFSPDGKRLVTGSWDQTARIWDVATGAELAVLRGHQAALRSSSFSPDGQLALTSAYDGTARIWQAEGSAGVTAIAGHTAAVSTVAFSPDGSRILTGSSDGTIRVSAADSGRGLLSIKPPGDSLGIVRVSEDGTRVLTVSADAVARVWDTATGAAISELRGHEARITAATISADGTRALTGAPDKTARLWDTATGRPLAVLADHLEGGAKVMLGPGGGVAVTFGSTRSTVAPQVWSAQTGALIGTLGGHNSLVSDAEFSLDGRRLATVAADGTVRIWDAATATAGRVLRADAGYTTATRFSPDGRRLVATYWDGTARIWDVDSGAMQVLLRGHGERVWGGVFSKDGTRVLTSSQDNTARIWDAATGQRLAILKEHTGSVWSAVFSPDNARILTRSGDFTARLWDGRTGAELGMLRPRGVDVLGAQFGPDGSRVATRNSDNVVRLWPVHKSTAELVERARSEVPRCLTPEEREKISLERAPPDWCIELEKWPYHEASWKPWLSERKAGRSAPMPEFEGYSRITQIER